MDICSPHVEALNCKVVVMNTHLPSHSHKSEISNLKIVSFFSSTAKHKKRSYEAIQYQTCLPTKMEVHLLWVLLSEAEGLHFLGFFTQYLHFPISNPSKIMPHFEASQSSNSMHSEQASSQFQLQVLEKSPPHISKPLTMKYSNRPLENYVSSCIFNIFSSPCAWSIRFPQKMILHLSQLFSFLDGLVFWISFMQMVQVPFFLSLDSIPHRFGLPAIKVFTATMASPSLVKPYLCEMSPPNMSKPLTAKQKWSREDLNTYGPYICKYIPQQFFSYLREK